MEQAGLSWLLQYVTAEQGVIHAKSTREGIHWPCAWHDMDSKQCHPVTPHLGFDAS